MKKYIIINGHNVLVGAWFQVDSENSLDSGPECDDAVNKIIELVDYFGTIPCVGDGFFIDDFGTGSATITGRFLTPKNAEHSPKIVFGLIWS